MNSCKKFTCILPIIKFDKFLFPKNFLFKCILFTCNTRSSLLHNLKKKKKNIDHPAEQSAIFHTVICHLAYFPSLFIHFLFFNKMVWTNWCTSFCWNWSKWLGFDLSFIHLTFDTTNDQRSHLFLYLLVLASFIVQLNNNNRTIDNKWHQIVICLLRCKF